MTIDLNRQGDDQSIAIVFKYKIAVEKSENYERNWQSYALLPIRENYAILNELSSTLHLTV